MDEKELCGRLLALEFNLDRLNDRLDEMALKTQKLELAYYQAFPDRADADREFEHQLESLILFSKPGAPKKLE
jgi:hypothetical protein